MPTQTAIYKHWHNDPRLKIDIDVNECFACGIYTALQRAHITAVQDGGNNNLDNLHLLCHGCHVESEIWKGALYWVWLEMVNKQAPILRRLKLERSIAIATKIAELATPEQIARSEPVTHEIINEILNGPRNMETTTADPEI